ncbi:MAG: coenzyme F420-0:L-glutamate ligase, partial [Candidatus Xenobia bacterium]
DCHARVIPDGGRYSGGTLSTRVSNLLLPRDDGYFEGIVVKLKDTCPLLVRVEVRVPGGDVLEYLKQVQTIRIELAYKFYNRSPIKFRRQEYLMRMANWVSLSPSAPPAPAQQKLRPLPAPDAQVLPLRTHLLRPEDDVIEVIKAYTKDISQPGDIIAIAESALAIMQGRVKHVDEIQPRFLARKINRFFAADSSLASCYSLEMAMREVGAARIVLATVAGVLGKVLGRSGDFYRVAGPDVATIDDCTGTLPPYDKCVVMGPIDCDKVVAEIKARTGLEAAVVDANDLKKCLVMAISDPALESTVHDLLLDNPQGNGGEQTPIVLIRRSPTPVMVAAGRG